MSTQSSIPAKQVGTIKMFRGLIDMFDFFKTIDIVDTTQCRYKDIWERTQSDMQDHITNNNIVWFGDPFPASVQEMTEREKYLRMDDYREIYLTKILPRLEELMKNSDAMLDMPKIKYNDRGLGFFDFNKASSGLMPTYRLYSLKLKSYVDADLTYTKLVGSEFKTYLISDNSLCVNVPRLVDGYNEKDAFKAFKEISEGANVYDAIKKYGLKIGGDSSFSSIIRKSYVYKQIEPKAIRAVRIFVSVGGHCMIAGNDFKFLGYTAVGLAELLMSLGYDVCIVGLFGSRPDHNIMENGQTRPTARCYSVILKDFGENIDSQRLLYICSDATFFRAKFFKHIIQSAQFYNDYITRGLGYIMDREQVKSFAYRGYGAIDEYWNKDGERNASCGMLYYIISNIFSQTEMDAQILEIARDVENENALARERAGFVKLSQQP